MLLGSMAEEIKIVLTGITDNVSDCGLEDPKTLAISDIEINVSGNDIKAYHMMGKPDKKLKSRKTIERFVNWKITHMWRRWGTSQNLFMAFTDELEKKYLKNCSSGPIKNKIILIFTILQFF